MKIATWNVNSIKARADHVRRWLETEKPDALFLQELKGESFPAALFEEVGYSAAVKSQKAYNGVAVLTQGAAQLVCDDLPGDATDTQARFLDVLYNGVRLINIYLPNGNPKGTDKFTYKLNWMDRLHAYIAALRDARTPFVLAGDFNVIPEAIDAKNPDAWVDDALYAPESRAKFRALCALGLTDSARALHPNTPGLYSFWDYQAGAWPRDHGIRIDHILLSPTLADQLESASIDRTPRGWDTPSDHTPVIVSLRTQKP